MLGGKMRPLFESPHRLLLTSGLQPLARYGPHQETISRRPEQMYTPFDTRLEWPGEGLLFELDSNERSGALLLKSCLGPLARWGTHQETMSGRLEQVYLSSDSRLDLPGERPLFELDFNKWWGGGQNVGTTQVIPWAITYVRLGPLARYDTGVNHYQM